MTHGQIQQVIDTLSGAAKYGFELLVRQQVVIGVQEMVGGALLMLSVLAIVKVSRRFLGMIGEPRGCNYRDEPTGRLTDGQAFARGAIPTAGVVVALTCLSVGAWLAIDGAGHLVNPAGFAITSLIPGD